jgi:hypothetical protein
MNSSSKLLSILENYFLMGFFIEIDLVGTEKATWVI